MKPHKLGIVIPWRPQPSRLAAFNYVKSWYELIYPDAKIYLVDTDHVKFNISAARNKGCLEAFSDGCDVVIVSDADILVDKESFETTIEFCVSRNAIAIPYRSAVRLNLQQSDDLIGGVVSLAQATRGVRTSAVDVGGVCVVSRIAFEGMNGWDENFDGWGHEDLAFKLAYDTLYGEMRRFAGQIVFLYHEDRDFSNATENLSRFQMYEKVIQENPEGLKELIKHNMVS
jgi:predicted glycosyltransferase involved in capsule biosynthesis